MNDKNKGRIQGFLFTFVMLFVAFWWFAQSETGEMTTRYLKWCREHGTAAEVEAGKKEYLKRYREQKEAERREIQRKRYEDQGDLR